MRVAIIDKWAFLVECFGDNGGWLEIVLADDEKVAINKCKLIYGKIHKNFKASIKIEFENYIE